MKKQSGRRALFCGLKVWAYGGGIMKSSAPSHFFNLGLARKRVVPLAAAAVLAVGGWEMISPPSEAGSSVSKPETLTAETEVARSGILSVSTDKLAATESAIPELYSALLDTDSLIVEEWREKDGEFEAISRLPDGRRIVVSARSDAQRGYAVESAAVAGEYILRTDHLPLEKWQSEGLLKKGRIEIVRSNEHLTQLRVPAENLERLTGSERMLFRYLSPEQIGRNSLVYPSGAPDDPKYAESWTLAKLDLEPVWEAFGYSPEAALGRRPIIAVVDDGAPSDYPDHHYWVNEGEIPGNGIDDDGNGYVDDITGYNWRQNNGDLSYSGGHGSTVARISASITNNAWGTASPASSAALMRVIYYENAPGTHWNALSSMLYAAENGADVINCSFITLSGTMFNYVVDKAEEQGSIIVAAAGNSKANLDDRLRYPASCPQANVITVGASGENDEMLSNYSATQVEVFAPGKVSSFSTPLVTSTLALLRSLDPEAHYSDLIAAVVEGADHVPALEGKCVGNGRLNVRGAVEALLESSLSRGEDSGAPVVEEDPEPPVAPVFGEPIVAEGSVELSWSGPEGIDGYEIHYSENSGEFLPVEPSAVLEADVLSLIMENLGDKTIYGFRVRAFVGNLYSEWTYSATVTTPEVPTPVVEEQPKPITEEGEVPSPVHYWDFSDSAGDPYEDLISGSYPISPHSAGIGSGEINGKTNHLLEIPHSGYATLANAETTNLGTVEAYTISFWLLPHSESLSGQPVLFEQGGGLRGLSIHLDDGMLVAGAWNAVSAESAWEGTWLQGPVLKSDEWVHISLTLVGDETLADGGLVLYVNGESVAEGPASQLWRHSDGIGIGTANGKVRINGKIVSSADPLTGAIADLALWNAGLNEGEIWNWFTTNRSPEDGSSNNSQFYAPAPGSPVVSKEAPIGGSDPLKKDDETAIEEEIYSAPQVDADGNRVVEVPNPAHFWDFEEGEGEWAIDLGYGRSDLKISGLSHASDLTGGSSLDFPDSHSGVRIKSSASINLDVKQMCTIAMWVRATENSENRTMVLYEQGGYWRGLNLILENGRLQANGWNKPESESAWELTTLHGGELGLGEWNHIAIVLEGKEEVKEGAFRLFVNGDLVDSGPASQLWVHSGAIGLGQVQGTTVYRNEGARRMDPFQGSIDDVAIWEAPLYTAQIEEVILQRGQ